MEKMPKNNYYYIIDAGHGGLDADGNYTTAPRKQYQFEDGYLIQEGVINRQIAKRLYQKMHSHFIPFSLVYDDVKDTSLTHRVKLVNSIHKKNPGAILIDLHSNAGKGKGVEIFTSKGQTKSDIIAELLGQIYIKNFPEFPFRKDLIDGDLDKEEDFTMVTDTTCPAVLIENFFFDNRDEAEFLDSELGQERITDTIMEWVILLEKTKPI